MASPHAELARAVDAQLRRLQPALPPCVWSQVIAEKRATYACTPAATSATVADRASLPGHLPRRRLRRRPNIRPRSKPRCAAAIAAAEALSPIAADAPRWTAARARRYAAGTPRSVLELREHPYAVDPDITRRDDDRQRVLPRRGRLRARARSACFARSWQWIGDLADVGRAGLAVAARAAAAAASTSRCCWRATRAATLRCLSNVCTHRGNMLVNAPCRAEQIRCGYHSRRFDLTGRMTFMPEFEQAQELPVAGGRPAAGAVRRPAPATAFASRRSPAAPLDDVPRRHRGARSAGCRSRQFRHDPSRDRDFDVAAHWALYVENYLEGLHIPFVHPALNQVARLSAATRSELVPLRQPAARAGEGRRAGVRAAAGSPDHGQRVAAYYCWVFPNLMLNFYPWGLSLNLGAAAGARPHARVVPQLRAGRRASSTAAPAAGSTRSRWRTRRSSRRCSAACARACYRSGATRRRASAACTTSTGWLLRSSWVTSGLL